MQQKKAEIGKISIALCTYNGAKFLPAQLESFLDQTRLPDELIIGDDNSTDETAQIIEAFAKNAPFAVHLKVNETNLGSTKNFERTIERCTGDLIFLSDQDDVWLAGKIERVAAEFEQNPTAALIFSDAELVDENLEPLGKKLWEFTFSPHQQRRARGGKMAEVLLDQNVVTGATAAFRAEFREKFMPIPDDIPNLIHDAWIALAIANFADVRFIDEPLIKYRQHSSQQLGLNLQSKEKRSRAEREKSYDDSIEFFKNEKLRLARLGDFFAFLPLVAQMPHKIEEFISEKQQRIEHYKARRNLPPPHLGRILPIVRELSSGRYQRFSKGFLSAAKDLFEKW